MYFEKSFRDVVATSLENQVKIINSGVIPRTFNSGFEEVDLVDFTRAQRHRLQGLVGLVNVDHPESQVEQKAHEYAKKIIIKFVCQGKLDENSMIRLLQLHETTLVACQALQNILRFLNFGKNMMFSSTHSEMMKTLLSLFHDDTTSIERRAAVFDCLLHVLHNEREDVIVSITEKVKELLATDSNPTLQIAIAHTLCCSLTLGAGVLGESPGIWESFLALLVSWKNYNDSKLPPWARWYMPSLCGGWNILLKTASNPKHLEILCRLFLSEDMCQASRCVVGAMLCNVSSLRENISKFQAIQGVMESLGDMLVKMVGPWQASGWKNRRELEDLASLATSLLGTLALETELRETIASLPGIEDGLQFWHLVQRARVANKFEMNQFRSGRVITSTRALTIIYSTRVDPSLIDLLVLEPMLEMLSREKGSSSKARVSSMTLESVLFCVHWTQAVAFLEMGTYEEALMNVNLAHDLFAKVGNPINQIESVCIPRERIDFYIVGKVWITSPEEAIR